MNLFTFVDSQDKNKMFLYSLIFVTLLWIFKSITVSIGIILGLVIWVVIVLYIYQRDRKLNADEEQQYAVKLDAITPKPKHLKQYRELIDFYFSVQDFYKYNPQAFEDIIDNTDMFLANFDEIQKNPERANMLYDHMYREKRLH